VEIDGVASAQAALAETIAGLADDLERRLVLECRLDELPVGVLTGLLGAPFFLVLLVRARRREVA